MEEGRGGEGRGGEKSGGCSGKRQSGERGKVALVERGRKWGKFKG